MNRYRDRADAGRALAAALGDFSGEDPIVLGIPRGGVVVAAEVAAALGGRLGSLAAVKVRPAPGSEFAVGAVTPDGTPMLDREVVVRLGLGRERLDAAVATAVAEVRRRQAVYGEPPHIGPDDVVIVVDDGVATGATFGAAIHHVRRLGPRKLVGAIPVAPPDTVARLAGEVDELVCPLRPRTFMAVGEFYDDFGQTDDAEVLRLLAAG